MEQKRHLSEYSLYTDNIVFLNIKKRRRSIVSVRLSAAVLLSIIAVCLFYTTATAAEAIWIGNIIIDYNLSNSLNKETSDKDSTSRHSLKENAHFRVIIKACGESAQNLRISNPDVSYTMTESRFRQVKKSRCVRSSKGPGDKDMVDYVTPGSSEKEHSSFQGLLHPDFPKYDCQSVLSVDPEAKEYIFTIALNNKPAVLIDGNSQMESRYACENETFIKDVKYISPIMLKAIDIEPQITASCDSSGRVCSATAPGSERILPIIASFAGKYDGGKKIKGEIFYPDIKSIYGSAGETAMDTMDKTLESLKELSKMSPGLKQELAEAEAEIRKSMKEQSDQYEGASDPDLKSKETLKVSWEFKIHDDCEDMIDELKESISMLRAYSSEELINKAAQDGWDGSHEGDGEVYDERVAKEGVRQYRKHWWDPGYNPSQSSAQNSEGPLDGGSAKIDMATNNDCKVVNADEVRDDYRKKCYPDVLFKAMYEHELTHARQCREEATSAEYKSGTPRSYQKFEIEAYCVGIGIILDYAKVNCKDCDLKPYEKEYKRLCGGKQ